MTRDLELAEEYRKVIRGIRHQQPFYMTEQDTDGEETSEDVTHDDSWNYADTIILNRFDRYAAEFHNFSCVHFDIAYTSLRCLFYNIAQRNKQYLT